MPDFKALRPGPKSEVFRRNRAARAKAVEDQGALAHKKREEAERQRAEVVATIYPELDGPAVVIAERCFQAFQMCAMGWSPREIAEVLHVSIRQVINDIDAERERRLPLIKKNRDHIVAKSFATLDNVIKRNFQYLSGLEPTPKGINPSMNIIRATAIMLNMAGVRVRDDGETAERLKLPSALSGVSDEMVGQVLAVYVRHVRERELVDVTPPNQPA